MFLFPSDCRGLSSEALGALATMVNVPECDYRSAACLHEMYPQDSAEQWQSALNELESKQFVIRVGDKYAVNKWKIPQMKVV